VTIDPTSPSMRTMLLEPEALDDTTDHDGWEEA
jgi:hypothetical protein